MYIITMDDEIITKAKPFYLGVIGSRQDLSQNQLIEMLVLILQECGKPPEKIIIPAEGASSIYISDWADSLKIPTQIYESDWRRHQRRAKIYRDARIQKESTHFLIFLNKRSQFNEKLSERLAKKNTVFTVNYNNDFELLILPSLLEQRVHQEELGSIQDTGKEKEQLEWLYLEGPEIQH